MEGDGGGISLSVVVVVVRWKSFLGGGEVGRPAVAKAVENGKSVSPALPTYPCLSSCTYYLSLKYINGDNGGEFERRKGREKRKKREEMEKKRQWEGRQKILWGMPMPTYILFPLPTSSLAACYCLCLHLHLCPCLYIYSYIPGGGQGPGSVRSMDNGHGTQGPSKSTYLLFCHFTDTAHLRLHCTAFLLTAFSACYTYILFTFLLLPPATAHCTHTLPPHHSSSHFFLFTFHHHTILLFTRHTLFHFSFLHTHTANTPPPLQASLQLHIYTTGRMICLIIYLSLSFLLSFSSSLVSLYDPNIWRLGRLSLLYSLRATLHCVAHLSHFPFSLLFVP